MRSCTCFLRIALSCLLLTASLAAQDETFVSPSDVSFRISTAQTTWKADESITLKYSVKNISYAPLFVPREWEATCPGSPHLWGGFEDSTGRHFVPGYGGSCSDHPQTIAERMAKEAVLLKPGEHLEGTFLLDPKIFKLPPGKYRVELELSGWEEEKFNAAEHSELARLGGRFMAGASKTPFASRSPPALNDRGKCFSLRTATSPLALSESLHHG